MGYDFSASVKVTSFRFVSFTDLAPFLDEISDRNFHVEASVYDFEPPAAGFSEIAISVITTGAAGYLAAFLASWAAEDAKALRAKLIKVMEKSKKSPSGRRYVPLKVESGRIRFYFHEPVNDEHLVERLRAAEAFVASLPAEAFKGRSGPGEYGLFWDDESKSWKGSIFEYEGEICCPEHLWSDESGGSVICPPN